MAKAAKKRAAKKRPKRSTKARKKRGRAATVPRLARGIATEQLHKLDEGWQRLIVTAVEHEDVPAKRSPRKAAGKK